MRKFFSSNIFGASKVFMTLAMLIASVVMAKAADPVPITEVNQLLTEGVTYSYPGRFANVTAEFIPEVDGTLRIEGFKGFAIYDTCTTPGSAYDGERNDWTALDPVANIRELKIAKGKPIYFRGQVYDPGTVTLYLATAAPLDIQYMQPDEDKVVDFNNYPSAQITFNQNTKTSDNNAIISFQNRLTNDVTVLSSRITGIGSQMLTIPFYTQLKPYIASGAIQPRDEFKVTVMGLQSEKGSAYVNNNADGNAVFTFLCGSIPTIRTNYYCPEPFMSYWPAGTPEGILTMTFDRPLGTSSETFAQLSWGNQEGEDGQFYSEILPIVIEGNKLSVDFTGKLRTPATMTPLYPDGNYSIMTIDVKGIVDEFGVPVGSEGLGTTGSYSFAPQYKLIEKGTLAAEFEPASGTDLTEVNNVNVWISGIKNISFDGFKLEVTDKNTNEVTTVVIPMSDVKVTPDGSDAAEYDFALPADVKANAKTVVITLNNVVGNDGYNHDNDIRATYGGFVVTYADPAAGSEMRTLDAGSIITIEANVAQKYPNMYVEYEIYEVDPDTKEKELLKSLSWMNRQADGSYRSEVFGDYKMMYGKEYHVIFSAWEEESIKYYAPEQTLGSDFIIWKGLTPPYIYSDIALTEMTPAADEIIEGDRITVTFDGIVNLGRTSGSNIETGIVLGMGAGLAAFREVTPVEPVDVDGTIYASTWDLVFPTNYLTTLTTPVNISFRAYDEQGRVVKGTDGEDAESYFNYQFDTPGMFKEISVDFGEEPITALKEIRVGYPTGINVSYDMLFSEIRVLNRMQQEVAFMEDFILDSDPNDPYATAKFGTIVLNNTIKEEGGYMLYIPRGFFNLGTEFETAKNAEVTKAFSIAMAPYTAIPEEGTVQSLETIIVAYNGGMIKLAENTDLKPYYNMTGIDANLEFASFTALDNELTLTLDASTTAAGTYTVIVPEGLVLFEDGTPAPAVELTYVIETAAERPNITVEPAEGKVTSIPQALRIVFDDYDTAAGGMGVATLTINNEAPITIGDPDIDWDDPRMNLVLQPTGATPEYTADGTYVFSFPAGYFALGDNGDPSPAFTLTYTIGETSNKPNITVTPAEGNVTSIPCVLGIVFEDCAEVGGGMGLATLTINGGEPITLGDAEVDWNDPRLNYIMQPTGADEYTAEGTYVFSFPEGYFGLDGQPSPAFTLTYVIGAGQDSVEITMNADSYTVYTINGVRLLDRANREALDTLAPGLYIINGVKTILVK